jgi:cytochrome bd-type quinol oxidase subunit 2
MSDLIKPARSVLEPNLFLPREGFLGAVAGVIAAILFGLPYLTMNQSGVVTETARLAILKNLMLYDFLFALVAGLTFQPYLQRIISKTELPDRLDKAESLLQPPSGGGTR